ncbi:MAG: hypothetical protein JWM05_3585 [Acidimicrobiales bacterium]|nr:hypothetical protein [Acidimicrobiales bacterium]
MDAITLLKQDHQTVEKLFQRYEASGSRAQKSRREVVDRIIEELSIHAEIEEIAFYPAVRAAVPDADAQVLEALEEHHLVKWTAFELEKLPPDHERFDAKVKVLMAAVRIHVKEEEDDLFPKAAEALGQEKLEEMGAQLADLKGKVPKHPHPMAPDQPPLNAIVGAGAAVVERVKDLASSAIGAATGHH